MADVHVPGLGNMPKGAVVAVVAGGGLVVFLLMRNFKNASAASTAPSSSASNVDPATGYPYGSTQDQAALAAQTGNTGGIDPMTGYPVGSAADTQALATEGYSGLSAGYPTGDLTTGYGSPTALTAPATNAAWSQQVQQTLTAIGYDPETVAGAVGAYLAKLPLTSNQASIVQVAIAEDGSPPQGSFSIVQQAGTPTPTVSVTVPNLVGQPAGQAYNTLIFLGLKPVDPHASAKGEPRKPVKAQNPAPGMQVSKGTQVQYLT